MRIFREGERTETGIIAPGQSSFEWLDNSAKPDAELARTELQSLFDRLPISVQPHFAERLRQAGPDHEAVVSEIYFHEAFRQSGYAIIFEPVTETGSRPEFQIEQGRFRAYVEVTTDVGAEHQHKDTQAINDLIYRTSERVRTLGFGVVLSDYIKGAGNPSPRRFAEFLDKWFSGFEHSAERSRFVASGPNAARTPRTTYREPHSGWSIEVSLWPLSTPDQRLESVAGSIGARGGWSTGRERLTSNIRKKLRQHKGADLPIVICVALNDFLNEPDRDEVVDALLGKSTWNVNLDTHEYAIGQRIPDGIWTPRGAGRRQRPIGLVLARRLYPWSLLKAAPELWDNPNVPADQLLPTWNFTRWRWDVAGSGELQNLSGRSTTLAPVS